MNNNFQPNVHWLSQNGIIFCIISSVMHAFWLVLTYDLLENRRIDDIIKTFNSLLYKTNRFQVAVHLFSNRSQMTSKCGKNKKVAHCMWTKHATLLTTDHCLSFLLFVFLFIYLFFNSKKFSQQQHHFYTIDDHHHSVMRRVQGKHGFWAAYRFSS